MLYFTLKTPDNIVSYQYENFRDFIASENCTYSGRDTRLFSIFDEDDELDNFLHKNPVKNYRGEILYSCLEHLKDAPYEELKILCRRMLHNIQEQHNVKHLPEHYMAIAASYFKNRFEKKTKEDIESSLNNSGASGCEYRPNKLAGYSAFGKKMELRFTNDDINLVTYSIPLSSFAKDLEKYYSRSNSPTVSILSNVDMPVWEASGQLSLMDLWS